MNKKALIARWGSFVLIWIGVFFVSEYFFYSKGSWHFDLLESILVPAILASVVWILIDWRPWRKDRNSR